MNDAVVLNIKADQQELKLQNPRMKLAKKSGEHSRMELKGVVLPDCQADVQRIVPGSDLQVFCMGQEKIIFRGIVVYVDISMETGTSDPLNEIHIKAMSYSCQLDRERKNRAFQNGRSRSPADHGLAGRAGSAEQDEISSTDGRDQGILYRIGRKEFVLRNLCSSRAKLVQGRAAVDLQVYSSSCKLDLKRKNRSFQDEQRSRGNLFSLLLKEYQGDFIWDQPGGEGAVGKFLMQYQETDWEFLKRVASQKGYLLSLEIHFPGIRVCVGLPKYQIRKTLPDRNCCIRSRMSGRWEYQMPGGMISFPEYVVEGVFEDFQIGEAVQFLELPLIGAAVQGTVTETTPTMSRLMLKTDGSGEKIRSWHHQPV